MHHMKFSWSFLEIKILKTLKENPRFFVYSILSLGFAYLVIFLHWLIDFLVSVSPLEGKLGYWPFATVPIFYSDMININQIPFSIFLIVFLLSLPFVALAIDFRDRNKNRNKFPKVLKKTFNEALKSKWLLMTLLFWSVFYVIISIVFHHYKGEGTTFCIVIPLLIYNLSPTMPTLATPIIPPIFISHIAGKRKGAWSILGTIIICANIIFVTYVTNCIDYSLPVTYEFIFSLIFIVATTILYTQSFIESE